MRFLFVSSKNVKICVPRNVLVLYWHVRVRKSHYPGRQARGRSNPCAGERSDNGVWNLYRKYAGCGGITGGSYPPLRKLPIEFVGANCVRPPAGIIAYPHGAAASSSKTCRTRQENKQREQQVICCSRLYNYFTILSAICGKVDKSKFLSLKRKISSFEYPR